MVSLFATFAPSLKATFLNSFLQRASSSGALDHLFQVAAVVMIDQGIQISPISHTPIVDGRKRCKTGLVQAKRPSKSMLVEDVLVIAGADFFSPMEENVGPLPEGDDAGVIVDFARLDESLFQLRLLNGVLFFSQAKVGSSMQILEKRLQIPSHLAIQVDPDR